MLLCKVYHRFTYTFLQQTREEMETINPKKWFLMLAVQYELTKLQVRTQLMRSKWERLYGITCRTSRLCSSR
uniref:Uncharacterized protein n=1 Tax=Arundo donax TaxID=35708 RepID=A0A0A9FKB5_ARUDO